MTRKQVAAIVAVSAILVGGFYYFTKGRATLRNKNVKQIQIEQMQQPDKIANTGPVSPISGISCENWNRRPFAIMSPADVSARPAAGFSEADMVFEMPVITASITRLMAVYVCGNPDDVGSLRSSRHDYIALAKGLDAIFVHWGGSIYAKEKLNEGVIDNMNCNNDGGKSAEQYCYRKEATGTMRGVDTGYAKFAKLLEGAKNFGYRLENKFGGYPHQDPLPEDQRPSGGHLRVAFAGPFAATYDYDKSTNTFLRTWGETPDTDRNNKKRIAPSNIAVLMARSDQIVNGEQYNNVQIGDPWYDETDSGDASYYMNGQQIKGSWKKDKTKLESKLFFFDENGQEIKFIPGQIWVEILEPGQALRWEPAS